jgi:hypothetical protein
VKRPRLTDYQVTGLVVAALLIGLVLVLFALASCATIGVRGDVVERAGLAEATSFTWDAYGRKDAPPKVRVVEGDELTCTDPASGKPGFSVILEDPDHPGRFVSACREGFTFLPTEVSVAWTGQPWSRTALAHELMHARQAREGVIDSGHTRPEWQPGGEVDQVNARLMAAGR